METKKIYTTAEKLAQMLGLSTIRVQQLRAEGAMATETVGKKPRYLLVESLVTYAKYLQEKQGSRSDKDRAIRAEADYKERKAELMKYELRKRKGELHEARHVKALMTLNNREIRAAFLALPGKIAPDLSLCTSTAELHSELRKHIVETLKALACRTYAPEEFRRMVESEGTSTVDTEDDEEDDTQ